MLRFVVVCAFAALVAAGPRPDPRPSNLVYSSYGLSVIPTAVSHQSRIEVESRPVVPPVVIKTTPVGATYSESVVVDAAGTHVINKPVYIARPAHQSVVKTVPSVTTYSHPQPVVATRLVAAQPVVSTQQVVAQPVVSTQQLVAAQPVVATQRVLSPQQVVAAQPVVATQRIVEAQPVVAAQPLLQSQPVLATQRVYAAQQPLVAAQPFVASQQVLSQSVPNLQSYGYVRSVPSVQQVVLNKNVISPYTQAIPAPYGYPPVGYKYVY